MANDFGIEEPQSDKARIVELVNMNLQQATNFGELAKRFDALKVELEEAKAHEIEAWDAKSAQDDENWKFIESLKSERDAALAQVVALREWIETTAQHPAFCGANWSKVGSYAQDTCTCGKASILNDTSAIAQRVKDEIEREALNRLLTLDDSGKLDRASKPYRRILMAAAIVSNWEK